MKIATTSLNGLDELFLETHTGMTSVMIYSNRTVSHEVKDKYAIQSHMKGRDGKGGGGELNFGPTWYKENFNQNRTIEINTVCVLLSQH